MFQLLRSEGFKDALKNQQPIIFNDLQNSVFINEEWDAILRNQIGEIIFGFPNTSKNDSENVPNPKFCVIDKFYNKYQFKQIILLRMERYIMDFVFKKIDYKLTILCEKQVQTQIIQFFSDFLLHEIKQNKLSVKDCFDFILFEIDKNDDLSLKIPDSEIIIIKKYMGYEVWNDELEIANIPVECENFKIRLNSRLQHENRIDSTRNMISKLIEGSYFQKQEMLKQSRKLSVKMRLSVATQQNDQKFDQIQPTKNNSLIENVSGIQSNQHQSSNQLQNESSKQNKYESPIMQKSETSKLESPKNDQPLKLENEKAPQQQIESPKEQINKSPKYNQKSQFPKQNVEKSSQDNQEDKTSLQNCEQDQQQNEINLNKNESNLNKNEINLNKNESNLNKNEINLNKNEINLNINEDNQNHVKFEEQNNDQEIKNQIQEGGIKKSMFLKRANSLIKKKIKIINPILKNALNDQISQNNESNQQQENVQQTAQKESSPLLKLSKNNQKDMNLENIKRRVTLMVQEISLTQSNYQTAVDPQLKKRLSVSVGESLKTQAAEKKIKQHDKFIQKISCQEFSFDDEIQFKHTYFDIPDFGITYLPQQQQYSRHQSLIIWINQKRWRQQFFLPVTLINLQGVFINPCLGYKQILIILINNINIQGLLINPCLGYKQILIILINNKNIQGLLINPCLGYKQILNNMGLPLCYIQWILLTNYHTEYDYEIYRISQENYQVELITSQQIFDIFCKKYSLLLDSNIKTRINFRPAVLGQTMLLGGGKLFFWKEQIYFSELGIQVQLQDKVILYCASISKNQLTDLKNCHLIVINSNHYYEQEDLDLEKMLPKKDDRKIIKMKDLSQLNNLFSEQNQYTIKLRIIESKNSLVERKMHILQFIRILDSVSIKEIQNLLHASYLEYFQKGEIVILQLFQHIKYLSYRCKTFLKNLFIL